MNLILILVQREMFFKERFTDSERINTSNFTCKVVCHFYSHRVIHHKGHQQNGFYILFGFT